MEDLIDLMLSAEAPSSEESILNGCYPEGATLEKIVTTLRDEFFPKAKLLDVPTGLVIWAAKIFGALNAFGVGVHPDRVSKLIRLTNIYPGWAVRNNFMKNVDMQSGLRR